MMERFFGQHSFFIKTTSIRPYMLPLGQDYNIFLTFWGRC